MTISANQIRKASHVINAMIFASPFIHRWPWLPSALAVLSAGVVEALHQMHQRKAKAALTRHINHKHRK